MNFNFHFSMIRFFIYCFLSGFLLIPLPLHASSITITIPELPKESISRWAAFQRFTGKGLTPFSKKEIAPNVPAEHAVFYPFGGADVIYPILLYPAAKAIILVGLEQAGKKETVTSTTIQNAFIKTQSLLRRSFFVTSQMAKDFSKEQGVIPIILFQLKLLGVLQVQVCEPDLPYPGVKVIFNHDGVEKSITYYQVNLHDDSDCDAFLKATIKQFPQICGLLKATSYCLHKKAFQKVRDFMIKSCDVIVQDDSGIPFKNLRDTYQVTLFGSYKGPYGCEFKGYFQKELVALTTKNHNNVSIPFCFGYGCGKQPPLLIFATKNKKVNFNYLAIK